MSEFTRYDAPLSIQYHQHASGLMGRNLWVVTEPFKYFIGSPNSGRYVLVPAGFLTDGASVPRLLWCLIPPWGKYGQAAVVHDYLCEYGTTIDETKGHTAQIVCNDREFADAMFLESMEVLEVPRWKQTVMGAGVNIYRKMTGKKKLTNDLFKIGLEKQIAHSLSLGQSPQLTGAQLSEFIRKLNRN